MRRPRLATVLVEVEAALAAEHQARPTPGPVGVTATALEDHLALMPGDQAAHARLAPLLPPGSARTDAAAEAGLEDGDLLTGVLDPRRPTSARYAALDELAPRLRDGAWLTLAAVLRAEAHDREGLARLAEWVRGREGWAAADLPWAARRGLARRAQRLAEPLTTILDAELARFAGDEAVVAAGLALRCRLAEALGSGERAAELARVARQAVEAARRSAAPDRGRPALQRSAGAARAALTWWRLSGDEAARSQLADLTAAADAAPPEAEPSAALAELAVAEAELTGLDAGVARAERIPSYRWRLDALVRIARLHHGGASERAAWRRELLAADRPVELQERLARALSAEEPVAEPVPDQVAPLRQALAEALRRYAPGPALATWCAAVVRLPADAAGPLVDEAWRRTADAEGRERATVRAPVVGVVIERLAAAWGEVLVARSAAYGEAVRGRTESLRPPV